MLGGTGASFCFKYRLSDSSLVGTISVAGASACIAVPQVGAQRVLAVRRTTGTVQFWRTDFSSATPLPTLAFELQEDGVEGSSWKSFTYDDLDGKFYIGEENSTAAFLYAFTPSGSRDTDEAIRLNSANTQPTGAAYSHDNMYVAQGDAAHIYLYTSRARVLDVPPQSGFDGEAFELDLAPYLANDIVVSFKSGTTPPTWLSLTSNVLSGTLPHVTRSRMDDTYNIQLTATHVDRTTDFNVQLTVKYVELPLGLSCRHRLWTRMSRLKSSRLPRW